MDRCGSQGAVVNRARLVYVSRRRIRATFILAGTLALTSGAALAYRPFDSTDAAVADDGEFELELGPIGSLREGASRSRVAPAAVANFGISEDREIVLQGQRQTLLDADASGPRTSVVDTGLFIKQVLRRGALQDEPGPSVATEYGFLLPTFHGESGTGFSTAGILSQRSDLGTVHLNSVLSLTRSHRADLLLGAILEGPYTWAVRPVAEVFVEQQVGGGRTRSNLFGAIWRIRDGLSFDLGVRQAHVGSEGVHEVRLGLTWSVSWRN
jgi:hypothetical protein